MMRSVSGTAAGGTTEDPEHRVDAWTRSFLEQAHEAETLEILSAMTAGIKAQLRYAAREAVGVQTPLETFGLGSGSCRDFDTSRPGISTTSG